MSGNYRDKLLGFLKSRAIGQPADLFAGRQYPRPSSAPLAGDDLGARFCIEAAAVGSEVSDLASVAGPAGAIREWLAGLGLGSAVVDSDPRWSSIGFSIREITESAGLAVDTVDGSTIPGDLAEIDLGITLADAAIAETGTIIQCARPFRPRSISLVPGCHLALVPRDRLLGSLEDFFEGIMSGADWAGGDADFGSYFTWMTGPSKTADIEKVLTVGVHGPGRTGIFLLPQQERLRS
jgi:L-lactate dehydrogenase complex protein LldG